jgi:NADP-dependent 3-hydroxy acid dehydrogenase YdfG
LGKASSTINRVKITAKQKRGYHVHIEEYNKEKLNDLANEIKALAYDIQWFQLDLIEAGKAINNPLAQAQR